MSRAAFAPGVRRSLRLGAVEKADAPAATTVHVAGAVYERYRPEWRGFGFAQRCSRCGRVLASLTDLELCRGAGTPSDRRLFLAARFFAEGRHIAEGPTSTYLVRDRPLAADEQECELVPAFAWED